MGYVCGKITPLIGTVNMILVTKICFFGNVWQKTFLAALGERKFLRRPNAGDENAGMAPPAILFFLVSLQDKPRP
jgi:hypothetical protein